MMQNTFGWIILWLLFIPKKDAKAPARCMDTFAFPHVTTYNERYDKQNQKCLFALSARKDDQDMNSGNEWFLFFPEHKSYEAVYRFIGERRGEVIGNVWFQFLLSLVILMCGTIQEKGENNGKDSNQKQYQL